MLVGEQVKLKDVCLFLLCNATDLYFLEHLSSKGCQWWLQDGKFSLQLPPSSKMQAATWLYGSACLKKTKRTSFFHVITKKIKGKKKKNSRDISGSTMVIFSRCFFLQGMAVLSHKPVNHWDKSCNCSPRWILFMRQSQAICKYHISYILN